MWVISRWFNVSPFHFIFCVYISFRATENPTFYTLFWFRQIFVLDAVAFIRPKSHDTLFRFIFVSEANALGSSTLHFETVTKLIPVVRSIIIIFLVFITRRATTVPFILDDNDIRAPKPSWLVSFTRCRRPTPPVRQCTIAVQRTNINILIDIRIRNVN